MATSHQARASRTWQLVAAGAGGAMLLTACTSTSINSSGSPAAGVSVSPAGTASGAGTACPRMSSLRHSLTGLTHLNVSPSTAGQMAADLNNIEIQVAALRGLGTPNASQSAQLTAELRHITLDAQAVIGDPTAARLAALRTALEAMKSTAQPLISQLKAICPGS